MFMKDNETMVIGIDHGFQYIKIAGGDVFANGVTELSSQPAIIENTLMYNEKYYKVGEGRLAISETKTESDAFYLLTLTAIAKELEKVNEMVMDIVLAVGLPFSTYGREKNSFREYLYRDGMTVDFEYENVSYSIKIVEVLVFPQCYAAISNRLINMKQEYLAVDIGSKTIDIVHISGQRPVESDSVTVQEALIYYMREIQAEVLRTYGKKIREKDIEDVIADRRNSLPLDIVELISEKLTAFTMKVQGIIEEQGFSLDFMKVIYLGGGATVMRKYSPMRMDNVSYYENIRANATGYEFLARKVLESR